jgi:hypothetical protein
VTAAPGEAAGAGGDVAGNAVLRMVVRHVIPAVRPDDVMTALSHVAALIPPSPPLVTRLVQGTLDDVLAGAADPARRRSAASPGPAVSARGDDPPEPPGAAAGRAGGRGTAVLSPGATSPEPPGAAAGRASRRTAASSGPGMGQPARPAVFARGGTVPSPGARPVPGGPEPSEAGPGVAQGQGVPAQIVKTTRPGEGTAESADTRPAGACNQLLRGADGPERAAAPGSSTGDHPDARERAARQRIGQ